jgi:uncharacterized protein involved in exopolysaccharide biosynthesis
VNTLISENPVDAGVAPNPLVLQLWRRRYWILLGTILGTALGVGIAYWVTPIYRSSTVVIPANTQKGLGGSSGMLGDLGGLATLAGVGTPNKDPLTDEAVGILASRHFIQGFLTDEKLLPVLYYTKWDAGRNEWKVPLKRQPTMGRAFKFFVKKIMTITTDRKSGLITIMIEWRDREAAARWANELIKRLNQEMSARAKVNADRYVAYLENARENSRLVETRDAINKLILEQIKQSMVATVSDQYAFRVVDPAIPADWNDPVRPNKPLFAAAGTVAGILLSCLAIVGTGYISRFRRTYH